MKRDWDTIREILLKTEGLSVGSDLSPNDFDAERIDEISYHVKLLEESGLVKASIAEFLGDSGIHFDIERLTWSGHEFLDAIRDDNVWKKIKKIASEKSVTMPFDVLKQHRVKSQHSKHRGHANIGVKSCKNTETGYTIIHGKTSQNRIGRWVISCDFQGKRKE